MTLVANTFATQLKNAIGFSDQLNSAEIVALATAIINEVKGATFSHATVTGTAPASGPLTLGTAVGGVIVGITPATLLTKLMSEMGVPATAQLTGLATAIANLILGLVAFSSGNIQGTCAAGVFSGSGISGVISGISGSAMASAAASSFGGTSSQLSALCNTIASYIMTSAVGAYAAGAVTGAYPPPPAVGGPMTGAGLGGTFS